MRALIAKAIKRHGINVRLLRMVPAPAIPPEIQVRMAPMQFVGLDATTNAAQGQVIQTSRRYMIDPSAFAGSETFAAGPRQGDRLIFADGDFATVEKVDKGYAHGQLARYDIEATGK